MKTRFLQFYFILFCSTVVAQNNFQIKGNFLDAKEKEIRLMGFMGTKDTLLSQTKTDNLGNFILSYPKKYIGAATIQVKEVTNLIVLLNNENFNITWFDFKDFNSVQFKDTKENEWFQQAFAINIAVQKRLAGLNYLLPLYTKDNTKKEWVVHLENEIAFENSKLEQYLKQLPLQSYVKNYLKNRSLLQQLQQENKTKEEEMEASTAFLKLDFGDKQLFYSGLSKEFFEGYLKQMLNLQNKEAIMDKLDAFSEIIKKSTCTTPVILNEYSDYLIKHYERYGLTEVAEKFALSLLNDSRCVIDNKTLPILEQYHKMAIGNIAPNMVFTTAAKTKSLKEVTSKYKVVVFGASWCEECKNELPQFKEYTETFKTKYNAEIVFVSIDTDTEKYAAFIKDYSFISSCDFKGWESPNVKNYFVFATPTIYVLNNQNKIVAKPLNAIATAKWLYDNSKQN